MALNEAVPLRVPSRVRSLCPTKIISRDDESHRRHDARCTCTTVVQPGYDVRMRHLARFYALFVGAAGLTAVGIPVMRAVLRRLR